ncbi:MAG: efflux RND transporter permease subunit, partial [Candidatus Obscuribacterales bacterium]
LVIFIFLGNLSATLIPSLALPISIVGTFAAMRLLNFSLDNLSLMALSLSVGFVVDDAIVMLENIVRHMEMGKSPMQAAYDGSAEIGFTILSMTLSLVAVFLPVLLLPGVVGRLFNEFGVTISIAILISGFISLSFTPMLCSRFLRPSKEGHSKSAVAAISDRVFDIFLRFYKSTLQLALSAKPLVMIGFVVMLLLTGVLFSSVPKGFMPNEDTGQLVVMTEADQGASFQEMTRLHTQLADIIMKDPNVESVMSSLGVGNSSPNIALNQGRLLIVLKPRAQRKETADQLIQEIAPKLATVPGINAFVQNPPTITIGGQVTKSLYQFTLSSPNMDELYAAAKKLQEKIKGIKGVVDVTSDLQVSNPEVHLTVNRDKCARFGVSMEQVEDALNSAYAARQISTMYTSTNQYWVIIEVMPRFYRDPTKLADLYLHSSNGQLVPLESLCTVENGVGPLLVNHLSQFPSVTISFNLKPEASLGNVTSAIKAYAKDTEIVPASVTTSFQGTAAAFEDSLQNLWVLLLLAVVVIYIVLGILYESFIHPITILSGLPSAGLGALLILMICHVDLNIYGFLGLIMLIGIVKKNAIMMIDFAVEAERGGHKSAEDAIYEACLTRFRPIMMTTMAALMGGIPIAVAFGAGSEARQPLGLTVVGGLLVSQLVTLYITPVFYIYLDRFQRRVFSADQNKGQLSGTQRSA